MTALIQTPSRHASPDPLRALEALEGEIRTRESLIVAFSGGVDSGVLLAVAARVLGDRVVAITADSASIPRKELEDAKAFARRLGVEHRMIGTDELDKPEYSRNEPDRCFWCKQTLFDVCARVAREEGWDAIAYGFTRDDVGDFRPGHRAAQQAGVIAPLHDAGLGKEAIRAIGLHLGLDLWDKPAAPCLSSRVPYGSEVTVEKLAKIEAMESLLHDCGFAVCRARFDGRTMRIELEPDQIPRAASPEIRSKILLEADRLGVALVTIDLEGFRSGKLNRSELR
ncbi:MAG: ATP-dependent sacrificial sulfur transferase LarE [Thermoanaerobaculia bacterium]